MSCKGRTIQLVRDLSSDEQKYLYEKSHVCKEAFLHQDYDMLHRYKIKDENISAYLLFQENSTRTKESFKNAAKFHDIRVNDFNPETSSFQKKESITDTVRMLMGYAFQTGFIVRTSYEGTCTWLAEAMKKHAQRIGVPTPFCINAGDGRHEHPTQEFLDEFTFVEMLGGDYSHIHIALIGDLFHGRTAHSKKDGLKIFREVEVDLIAPEELAMPSHYQERMKAQGFSVRTFTSLNEYLAQKKIAPIWYFTRVQMERMGEQLLRDIQRIQDAVIFKKEYMTRIPAGVKFFHPLPRNKEYPIIPPFLDDTPYNGWDLQSAHGYHIRFVLLGMLAGSIGEDFEGNPAIPFRTFPNFIRDVTSFETAKPSKPVQKFGIKPIENGIVIDHIGLGHTISSIWNTIDIIRRTLHFDSVGSHGVFSSMKHKRYKGIISIPDHFIDMRADLKRIGAISSGCTINVVKNSKVVQKLRVAKPHRIYNFEEIHCRNKQCISHPSSKEPVYADFYREDDVYLCNYCEMPHSVREIWPF